jgi:hypothetical protein
VRLLSLLNTACFGLRKDYAIEIYESLLCQHRQNQYSHSGKRLIAMRGLGEWRYKNDKGFILLDMY